jgi:general secretion pathway protein H
MSQRRGFSLVEIMVALAIVTLILGGATLGIRGLVKSELRGAAGRLSAAIRYSYDKAIATGSYYRLHFDLDERTYRLEKAEGRFVLSAETKRVGRGGRGLDQDKEDQEEERDEARKSGLSPELLPPPSPRRARFSAFKDSNVKPTKLGRVRVLDVRTKRQDEPFSAGHAYLHFFPDGHTERAVIHLGTDSRDPDDQYTLVVHALTGRVEVRAGRYEPPAYYDEGRAAR